MLSSASYALFKLIQSILQTHLSHNPLTSTDLVKGLYIAISRKQFSVRHREIGMFGYAADLRDSDVESIFTESIVFWEKIAF